MITSRCADRLVESAQRHNQLTQLKPAIADLPQGRRDITRVNISRRVEPHRNPHRAPIDTTTGAREEKVLGKSQRSGSNDCLPCFQIGSHCHPKENY